MIRHLLLFGLLVRCLPICAQDFGWAIRQSGSDAEAVYQVAEDAAGNIYEAGNFWSTVDFNPSAATFNLTSAGLTDNFICKLDVSGNFLWAKRVGGTGYDNASNICVDVNNTIYTGGKFQNTVDFDPSPATYNLTAAGGDEAFIAAYSTDGHLLWASKFGSTGADFIEGLVQQDGFVYATGYFQGTVDFDPGTGVYNLSATGADATFFLKLDTAGNFIWAKSISGTSSILAFDIDADVTGNVIAGGEFWGTCDFNPGTGIQSKSATNFSSDAFLLKLDANGNFVWVDIFNGDNDEWVKSIDLHSNGDVGVCGVFQGTTDFSPGAGTYNLTSNGNYDVFIARMNADGSLNWAGAVGGTFNDQLGELDISMSGDYFLTGGFSGSVDFDPGAGNYTINGPGSTNIFYLQLNSSGTFVNAYGFGTINSSSIGNSIHADDAGRITMAGGFEQTIDFDPGIAVYNLTSILGTSDCFVLQLNSCIPAEASINATICSGDSIFASGEYQTVSGEYIDYLTASDGCDSIVTLHLTVLPSASNNVIAAICEGDNYLFEGSTLTDAGIYTVHLVAGNGCDSTITLTLTVHPNYETILNATICEGNTFPFNGNEMDSTGTYMANLLATTGCDSMITLHLEVLPIMNTEISENICEGETFLFNGMTLNTAGDYSAALISNSGCDSLVTLHLTETIINAAVMQSNDTLFATGNGSIQWILCESGLPIPGADQTIFIPIQAGTYAAVFTNGNCSDTTVCKYYTVINAPVANFNVEVYPNPAREKITIQISDYSFPVTAELRNVFGELIEQKEFSKIVTFELQELPSGIYFLPIFSTNNSVIKKIVVGKE